MTSQLPHILLIGSTGQTGRLVLAEALRRGHTITALVRNSASLESQPNLSVVQGNPTEASDIEKALSKATAASPSKPIVIVSTLGQTRKSGNPWSATTSPAGFMGASSNAVLSTLATKKFPTVQKYIVMSVFGAGKSFRNLNFLMRAIMNYSNMAQTVEDHNLVDEVVKKSDVNFVLVRASMLKDSTALPVKELGNEGEKAGFMPSVTRQTVTAFLLDAVVSSEWDGQTPVIAN